MVPWIGSAITLLFAVIAFAVAWGKLSEKIGEIDSTIKNHQGEQSSKLDKIEVEFSKKQTEQNGKLDRILEAHGDFKAQTTRLELEHNHLRNNYTAESNTTGQRINRVEIKQEDMEKRLSDEIKTARHAATEALNAANQLHKVFEYVQNAQTSSSKPKPARR